MHRKWLALIFVLFCFACPANLLADIRIFGLSDLDLGRWTLGVGSLQTSANICVAVRPRGPYQITAFGTGTDDAFVLSSGVNNLPYRVFFNDRPRPNGAEELLAGQVLGGLRGRPRGIRRNACNRPSAYIAIQIEDRVLQRSSAGQYSGSVILVVGPE